MATRTLKSPPSMLALYARSALAMVPGASLLPAIPGAGSKIPPLELTLARVAPEPAHIAAYAEVCGFAPGGRLPVTYPHVLAFPLHMALMSDGSFPFGPVGLVHVENRITQHRPIGVAEELQITVRATALEPHPRGQSFSLLSEVRSGGEPVWESESRMLRRGGGQTLGPGAGAQEHAQAPRERSTGDAPEKGAAPSMSSEWSLAEDLGRRYAAVSGDRNPIHLHALSAKAFGFSRAIAHGMWSKARSLAALESGLPDSYTAEVRFRKPILLPAHVKFSAEPHETQTDFTVTGADNGDTHLDGNVRPPGPERNPR